MNFGIQLFFSKLNLSHLCKIPHIYVLQCTLLIQSSSRSLPYNFKGGKIQACEFIQLAMMLEDANSSPSRDPYKKLLATGFGERHPPDLS